MWYNYENEKRIWTLIECVLFKWQRWLKLITNNKNALRINCLFVNCFILTYVTIFLKNLKHPTYKSVPPNAFKALNSNLPKVISGYNQCRKVFRRCVQIVQPQNVLFPQVLESVLLIQHHQKYPIILNNYRKLWRSFIQRVYHPFIYLSIQKHSKMNQKVLNYMLII